MRTQRIIYIISLVTLIYGIFIASPTALAAETYVIDPVHSSIVFRVKHLGFTYVSGRFANPEGKLNFDSQSPEQGSVRISVKTATVDTDHKDRDKHLRSPDFFDADKYPNISFKSDSVKKNIGDGYEVSGTLDLHGVRRPLRVQMEHVGSGKDPWGGYRAGFDTTFTIKRSDFDMRFGPNIVSDNVRITVSIEAVQK